MTRGLYQLLLCIHPPQFRQRFCDEMLSIFDERPPAGCFALLLDALRSLARQWLLRTRLWKLIFAISGAYVQVFGFDLPLRGHQSWTVNRQALTPDMQGILALTVGLIGGLFLTVTSLALWTMRFHRRRSVARHGRSAATQWSPTRLLE